MNEIQVEKREKVEKFKEKQNVNNWEKIKIRK